MKSSPEIEKLLEFQLPERTDVNVYLVKDKDGKIIARTEEELEFPSRSEDRGDKGEA